MADRREMLARLNPQTVRFDVGQGGGTPALTTSDIAAALGMVPAGLGREVMEAVYLPDGATRHRAKLAEAVLAIVRPEFTRRARAVADAEADLEFAQAVVSLTRRGLTDGQRRQLREREGAVVLAKANAWPRNTYQHLSRMVDAVVLELASGNRCTNCRGTGQVSEKACPDCRSTGIEPLPDRRRALAMGCHPSDYPKRWKPVFEWLLSELNREVDIAARQLSRALSNSDRTPQARAA
ncbi:hypothetical protein RZA67_09825 [Stenotrophomonas sp. C3(2023)]|uniref:hypothetical protein n=1 Tax=Stenotrophomonas sp. C3(2023) TaxID=3080277 RepID=UPI00293C9221|nr:hypothetical protein [Stenotrophomonas sp. C3(2023)]MDV3469027.1 hypothetical protein [Stenotrophomonas sp. C3(2023)]